MSDISITNTFATDDVGTAKKMNDNFKDCTTVINGDIDTGQISDGSITDAKLAGSIPLSSVDTTDGMFFTSLSGDVTLGGDLGTDKILFDTAIYNIGGHLGATGTYHVPADGIYYFYACVGVQANAGNDESVQLFLEKSRTTILGQQYTLSEIGDEWALTASWLLSLTAGNQVAIRVSVLTPITVQASTVANYQTRFLGFPVAKT